MILLTGGAGFVGSNLLKRLNALGEEDILVVDNLRNGQKYRNLLGAKFHDYADKEAFLQSLRTDALGRNIQAIFHQGACTNTLEYDGEYMLRNNFEYSKTLLHFAIDHRIPFIYASSAAVYGQHEIAIEDDDCESPMNIYGYSKLLFDRYVQRLMPGAESTIVGLRYFNAYGNGESHKGRMASMVHQLYLQVRSEGVARLFGEVGGYGPGEQKRDFVFVKDLVDINLYFWQRDPVQAIVNAGTGVSRSWNDLARAVIVELGAGTVEYIDFPDHLIGKYQYNSMADLTKLRTLGYEDDFFSLERGVQAYLSTMEVDSCSW